MSDFSNMLFVLAGTPRILFHYPLFKKLHKDHCVEVLGYFQSLVDTTVREFGEFELHVNMASFSVSACVRYQSLIQAALETNAHIASKMSVFVYNSPCILKQMNRIFFASLPQWGSRITCYSKFESEAALHSLQI